MFGVFPKSVDNFLKEHGNKRPTNIQVHRQALGKAQNLLLDVMSRNQFKKQLSSRGYDSAFHAWLTMDLGGVNYNIEKVDLIKMSTRTYDKPFDSMFVSSSANGMTLNQIIEKAYKAKGRALTEYDPMVNNCQRFVVDFLDAAGLNSAFVNSWTLQPLNDVIKSSVSDPLIKATKGVMTTVGLVDRALQKVTNGKVSLPLFDSDLDELDDFYDSANYWDQDEDYADFDDDDD